MEENLTPVKICTLCGETLKYLSVYLFDMEHIKKYLFECKKCDVTYDVYINELTRHRASYQTLLN